MTENKLVFSSINGSYIEEFQHEGPESLGNIFHLEFHGEKNELDRLANFIKEKTNIAIKNEKKTTDLLN